MISWRSFAFNVRLALETIRGYKLRAFLTVLGVIIGTSAVIGVGSILAGLNSSVTGIFQSFGTNTMLVFKHRIGFAFFNTTPEEWKRKPLTYENARAIAERCPSVEQVSPFLFPDMDWRAIHRARY
ncbi:MAG: ABC transporter permease, partial [Acidobacteria bacterium]|nr:ABC transporter permease [Acidobacteriota bacterium]